MLTYPIPQISHLQEHTSHLQKRRRRPLALHSPSVTSPSTPASSPTARSNLVETGLLSVYLSNLRLNLCDGFLTCLWSVVLILIFVFVFVLGFWLWLARGWTSSRRASGWFGSGVLGFQVSLRGWTSCAPASAHAARRWWSRTTGRFVVVYVA